MGTLVKQKGKRAPRCDKDQRRHLRARIEEHHQVLAMRLNRELCAASRVEPEHVVAARRVIEEYEEKLDDFERGERQCLCRFRDWLCEQVLFASTDEALSFVKRYEALSMTEAMEAGRLMEDRNDLPVWGRLGGGV
jgi:hypothetical protein